MGCGIHIVWGIFRVFNWHRCSTDKDSSIYLRFVIWSWYIGAMVGSFVAGFIVTKLRKRQIYVRVFLNFRYFHSLFGFLWASIQHSRSERYNRQFSFLVEIFVFSQFSQTVVVRTKLSTQLDLNFRSTYFLLFCIYSLLVVYSFCSAEC